MSSKKTVLVVCNRCKERLQIEVDLDEIQRSRKGGLFSVEVHHGESGKPHSTIFYLSLAADQVQVRGQVTADSIAESIRTSSGWDISAEQADAIDQLLKNFIGLIPEIEMVFVSDIEGKTTGLKAGAGISRMRIAQIETIVNQIISGVAKSFQSTPMGTSVFEMGDIRFVFVRAGPQAMITVVSDLTASTESVLAYAYLTAEKLARILEGELVSVDMPLLEIQARGETEKRGNGIRYLVVRPGSYVAKLVMVGDEGVGKTSLVQRFVENTFTTDYKPTIGVSIMTKTVKLTGQETQIQFSISDLAGQEQFARVRRSYFRGAHASFIVYDVTSRASFEAVKPWYKETLDYAGRSTIVIIIGNKADLTDQREVKTEEALELVRNMDCTYVETSAKTGENVAAAFSLTALFLVERAERVIEGKSAQDFILEDYLKGRALPAEMIEKITTMIAEFEYEIEF